MRTGGKVRFLRISTRVQLGVVAVLALLLGGWGVATGAMLWTQAQMGMARANLERERAVVSTREATVNAYRQSVNDIATDIQARQQALEAMMRANLGVVAPDEAAAPIDSAAAKVAPSGKVGAVSLETRLKGLRVQQLAFEDQLHAAAEARLADVERAIRSFGLNPARFAGSRVGQGGPFVPADGAIADDASLRELAVLLGRLNAMEETLASIPSTRPTAAHMMTSSYGYRRDPFNGRVAFHSGTDFRGSYGQAIKAAASGRVKFVGRRPGYGKVVEIDHGHAIMTRYAHLSGYTAKVGATVTQGQMIGRMGSTGRSTGTHLHFEVRVRGAAVNPRRFLEARQDVLEVQKLAKKRLDSGDRG